MRILGLALVPVGIGINHFGATIAGMLVVAFGIVLALGIGERSHG